MKFLAILKDSLKETIDSSVFFVVLAFSGLAFLMMATVSLEPNPPAEGLDKLADKLPDGRIDVPVMGKQGDALTNYKILNLNDTGDNKRPWAHEYSFTLEGRDGVPFGTRIAILEQIFRMEHEKMKEDAARKSRLRQLQDDLKEEMPKIQERHQKKGGPPNRMFEEMQMFFVRRLEKEARSLPANEMEEYIKAELKNKGNWDVRDVKLVALPEKERTIPLKVRVLERNGEEVKAKTIDATGEVLHFEVKLANQASTYRIWPHRATVFFGAIPIGNSSEPGRFAYNIVFWGIECVGAPLIMLLASVITAFYIPNMLRKGTIDLLLAKPIARFSLLAYKYIGGLTFMFLTTAFLITGLWVTLGVRSGIWEPAFLLFIPVLTFQFALFYALSTMIAVFTRSPIVCILGCVLLYGLLLAAGQFYSFANVFKEAEKTTRENPLPSWVVPTAQVTHGIAPHFYDLYWLTDKEVQSSLIRPSEAEQERLDKSYSHYNWAESILVTSLWILLFLLLAYWRFAVKDF